MNIAMKLKNIIPLAVAALSFVFNSCYEDKMEWNDPYTHIPAEELPIDLQEKIGLYNAINSYATFKIGVGIDLNLYVNDEAYRNLVNQNFDEITPGNEMKQQSLMDARGVLNFDRSDPVLEQLKAAGLTVYGHTLVWHQQAQATYFNSLIMPVVIPGTPGSSLIDGSFEDGMGGWSPNFNAQDYTIVSTEAIDGTHSLQAVVGSGAAGKYDAQLTSPGFPIISGHHYQISFWIKGSVAGQIGIDFPNGKLGNQYPWVNGAEMANIGTTWTQVIYNTSTVGGNAMIATEDDNGMTVRLLLGAVADCTYLIDGVEIIDLDAAPTEVNLVTNGDFESGDLTGWATPNPGAGITVDAAAKYAGSYGLQAISSGTSANEWDLQFQTSEIVLDATKTYTVSFMVKSDIAGSARISYTGLANGYPWTDWDGSGTQAAFTTSSAWKLISYDLPTDFSTTPPKIALSFDFGKIPGVTYFIDDVKLVEKPVEAAKRSLLKAGPVTIEKTPEEKAEIINAALIDYITDVVTHYKGKVAAWEVVNEPMNENGTLRTGEEDLTATSVFHWAYYLGNDYAVTAFKAARAADPDAKLFINDYGLESASSSKLDGLIEYVNYIDKNGGQVDGIGTQLHMNINWSDTTAIGNMFTKLAATGKMIKVTELDIAISSESNAGNGPASPVAPTLEQQEKQVKLYEYVARMYTKLIPPAQQYGITVWGISDKAEEHTYWLPNDAPCLWDADYARKWAYKGFCDGLFGSDVSADWTYDDLVNAAKE